MENQTLFVLGAGSSAEVGLPIGKTLIERIAKLTDMRFERGIDLMSGDWRIVDALRLHAPTEFNLYRQAGCQLATAMEHANSIDDYLDIHQDDERIKICGKLAIVQSILQAERDGALFIDAKKGSEFNRPAEVAKSWFARFFSTLQSGITKAKLPSLFGRV
jgi:hypothetical protein